MKLSLGRSLWTGALLAVIMSAVVSTAGADVQDPGARKRLGQAGEWKDTMVGVVLNEKIYTVEKGGGLYKTDMATGKWEQIPKANFPKARFLMAAGSNLYYSNTDGDLYVVNPSKGTKSRLGARGVWKNVVKAVGLNGALYSITNKGAFYRTDVKSGKWKQIGKTDYADTLLLMNHEKAQYSPVNLFSIEKSGSLYKLNPADGGWVLVGKEKAWANIKYGAIMEETDTLYAVNYKGELVSTMLSGEDTAPYKLGKADFKKTTHLFVGNGTLCALDSDGSLYSVQMAPMAG